MATAPRKIELVFFRNDSGGEPVRLWLRAWMMRTAMLSERTCCGRSGGGQ